MHLLPLALLGREHTALHVEGCTVGSHREVCTHTQRAHNRSADSQSLAAAYADLASVVFNKTVHLLVHSLMCLCVWEPVSNT